MHRFGAAKLHAVLHDAVVLLGRSDKLLTLEDVVGAGLFDIDVFAGLAAPNGGQSVPVVGGSDADAVDRLVVEHLAQVLLDRHAAVVGGFELRGALRRDVAVGINERGHLDVVKRLEAFDVALASPVDAQNGDANTVVRTQYASSGGERHSFRCRGTGGAFKEGPSLHRFHLSGWGSVGVGIAPVAA